MCWGIAWKLGAFRRMQAGQSSISKTIGKITKLILTVRIRRVVYTFCLK